MADINLLPDRLRREEAKERERLRKTPKRVEVRFTSPEHGEVVAGKGFWKKLFGGAVEDEKALNLPKVRPASSQTAGGQKGKETPDFLKKGGDRRGDETPSAKLFGDTEREKGKEMGTGEEPFEDLTIAEGRPFQQPFLRVRGKDRRGTVELTSDDEPLARVRRFLQGVRGKFFELTEQAGESAVVVNLMPEGTVTFADINWKKIGSIIAVTVVIASLIVSVSYLVLLGRTRAHERLFAELQSEISVLDSKLTLLEPRRDSAFRVNADLFGAGKLFSEHIYWTKFLAFLEEYTLDSVRYSDFKGTPNTPIVLNAVADNLTTALLQKARFKEAPRELVSDAVIKTFAVDEDGKATFTIELTVSPSAWRK
jgi:hypothetical protein